MSRNIERANAEAARRIAAVEPRLTDFEPAAAALGLADGELGHAGPPFESVDDIPLPVLNALAGAALHEGWACTPEDAKRRIAKGEIALRSNHALGTVSPMTGVIRPGQMLARIENAAGGGLVHATLAESGRRALRFGVYDANIAEGLSWLDEVLAPALARALPPAGLPLLPVIQEAVALGDDVHQRNVGGMHALVRALDQLDPEARGWLLDNPQHALNYAMASAKLALDAARGVAASSIVTAISRNGDVCGIQLAGTGERWFTARATIPDGAFFPPHGREHAQADLGDSAIMEAYGLGGAAAHIAPELARTMNADWNEAEAAGRRMRECFVASHPRLRPALAGPEGLGLGLDAGKVIARNEAVRIHTGISHRDGATGWIGIGVAFAPVACFTAAMAALHGGTCR